jgi:hypothetical protein
VVNVDLEQLRAGVRERIATYERRRDERALAGARHVIAPAAIEERYPLPSPAVDLPDPWSDSDED